MWASSAKEFNNRAFGATLDSKCTKRAQLLKTIQDDFSGQVAVALNATLQRARRCTRPRIGARLAAAISSLKVVPEVHFDYETHATSVTSQLQVLFIIFYDPPARVLHKAWEGFRTAVASFGAVALFATMFFSYLGLSPTLLVCWLMYLVTQTMGSRKFNGYQFFRDVAAFFILDEPHLRDPLGVLEDILGNLLKLVVYVAVTTLIIAVCLVNYGEFWSVIKAFLFWNIVPALGCGLTIVVTTLLVAAGFHLVNFTSQTSYGPYLQYPFWVTWYFAMRLFLLCNLSINFVLQLLQIVKLSIAKLVHLCMPARESLRRPRFRYQQLDPGTREIRLLKVVRKSPFSAPTFSLATFPLDKAPPYDAVSYTWDGQDRDADLCLDNRMMLKTTKNVKRIAYKRATLKWTSWLWIDAVCINQDDADEKPAQLQLMGDIYRTATRVLAWLDYEDVSLIDLTLMHILNRHLWEKTSMLPVIGRHSGGLDGRVLKRMWWARTKFVFRSYWTRCWIVQELALAKKIHIVYGGQMLKWDTLEPKITSPFSDPSDQQYRAIEKNIEHITIAEIERSNRENGGRQNLTKETRSHMSALIALRSFVQRLGSMGLSTALFFTSEFESSKDYDKVISLLGMIKDYPADLLINANLPAKDLFVKVAQHLLLSDPDFVLISGGIGYPRKIDNLPSWAPDWTAVSIYRQVWGLRMNSDWERVLGPRSDIGDCQYSCGMPRGSPSAKPGVRMEGLQISIKSIRVSQICELSPPFVTPLPKDISNMASFLNRKSELANLDAAEKITQKPS